MEVVIFMVERFQKNKRWIKNAYTIPAEINSTLMMSWFVSPIGCGVFTWTSVEVLSIGFERWEVGLLIFDDPLSICLTSTDPISKFTDLLTPSSCPLQAVIIPHRTLSRFHNLLPLLLVSHRPCKTLFHHLIQLSVSRPKDGSRALLLIPCLESCFCIIFHSLWQPPKFFCVYWN